MSEINVSLDEAYQVALVALAEAIVRERLLRIRLEASEVRLRASEDEVAGLRERLKPH